MIVTTALKAHCVNSLQDYMKIKGMYMKYRLDPTIPDSNPDYYLEIVKFIEMHTDLPKNRFWYELDLDQKQRFVKFLHFSDDVPNQFNIRSDEKQAQVCVVLNGSADVLTRKSSRDPRVGMTETKETFSQGRCFGSFDTFDEIYDVLVNQELMSLNSPGKNFRIKQKEKKAMELLMEANGGKLPDPPVPTVMTVLMEKGTWLHIGIRDYKDFVLEVQPEEQEVEEETDEQISGIPRELMTAKDLSCVAVKRAAKRKLAMSMFNFMSKYELIPHNAAVMSSEFVGKGNAGRAIGLSRDFVYAIIEGRACLQVCLEKNIAAQASAAGASVGTTTSSSNNNNNNKSSTSGTSSTSGNAIVVGTETGPDDPNDKWWAYKEAKAVMLKRKDMPVLRMEAGTLLSLQDDHYLIGYEEPPETKPTEQLFSKSIDSASESFLPDISTHSGHQGASGVHEASQNTKGLTNKMRKARREAYGSNCPYFLRFVNETPVTYLAIPRKTFTAAMRDVPVESSEDIQAQLDASASLTLGRMQALHAWVRGVMKTIRDNPLNPPPKPKKSAAEEAEERRQELLQQAGLPNTRGLLRRKKPAHPRDVPPVNILEDPMVRRYETEGSFMTTQSLKPLNEQRQREIDEMVKSNRMQNNRSRSASPEAQSNSRPTSSA